MKQAYQWFDTIEDYVCLIKQNISLFTSAHKLNVHLILALV